MRGCLVDQRLRTARLTLRNLYCPDIIEHECRDVSPRDLSRDASLRSALRCQCLGETYDSCHRLLRRRRISSCKDSSIFCLLSTPQTQSPSSNPSRSCSMLSSMYVKRGLHGLKTLETNNTWTQGQNSPLDSSKCAISERGCFDPNQKRDLHLSQLSIFLLPAYASDVRN